MSLPDWLGVVGALVRILWRCPELPWYLLPRAWRGGWRSPWDSSS